MPNLESVRHPTLPMIQTARVTEHACLFRLLLRCSSSLDRASYFGSKPAATKGPANSFSERVASVQEI